MDYDIIIIGAGPGGYVAAIRAGQTGLKTAVIEKDNVGGMCLNWGCIPTKALLESAKKLQAVKTAETFGVDGIDRKKLTFNWPKAVKRAERIVKRLTKGVQFLLKKNGVDLITGTASINNDKSVSVDNRTITAKNIIIATGSKPLPGPENLPQELTVEVRDLLALENLPENLVIWGNGPHAIELAQFARLADKSVTLATSENTILPETDPFLSLYSQKLLKKLKIDILYSAKIKEAKPGELILEAAKDEDDSQKIEVTVPCDRVINASNRYGIIPDSNLPIDKDSTGRFITVNDHLQTTVDGIFAIGDVNGRSIFAHAASAQGLYVINRINGISQESLFDVEKFPVNIYTSPEIAQIGLTEQQASQLNGKYKVSEFPLSVNGKALTEGESEGIVRIISDKKYGEVLGVQIVSPTATDMIAEAALVMQMEGTVHDIARTVHAHPTISEVFMEAGLDAFDQAIHK